jgi:hypothetical protein
MFTDRRFTLLGLLAALILVVASVPGPALADRHSHRRKAMAPGTIPDYTYGEAYSISGLPGLYVTVTTSEGKNYVIPAPPYDHRTQWGDLEAYDQWKTQFRSQNRGKIPTTEDETDYFLSLAMAGALTITPTPTPTPEGTPGPTVHYMTFTTSDGQQYVIPTRPFDHSMPWGSEGTYDNWAAQFRAQHGGQDPTPLDELDYWIGQAKAGLVKAQ